ncbi:MAG: class I SAM-dependent methyltransferase [Proteobacteria bacterium]|nr:class I SAM-dependent methyltransferase [Pseudomonadota bacterium]
MPSQLELNRLYGDDRGITSSHYPKARSRYSRALKRALRLLPWIWRKSVVDLGCGGGFLTNAFRIMGARASGIDVNSQAIEYAESRFPLCTFHASSFENFKVEQPYDFVYSSELIEHVSNLSSFMRLLQTLTTIGSHVFITTPDIGSHAVPINLEDWDVFCPPHHVQFFGEKNLRLLFARYGFEQVKRYPDRKAGLKVLFRRTSGETVSNKGDIHLFRVAEGEPRISRSMLNF